MSLYESLPEQPESTITLRAIAAITPVGATFEEEARQAVLNVVLGKDGEGHDLTFGQILDSLHSKNTLPLTWNHMAKSEANAVQATKNQPLIDETENYNGQRSSIGHRRVQKICELAAPLKGTLTAIIDLSLKQNNPLVEKSVPFNQQKSDYVTTLTTIGNLIDLMSKTAPATDHDIERCREIWPALVIERNKEFQTHVITDQHRFDAIVSLKDKAPEIDYGRA